MKTTLASRTAANLRAALTIVAFTVLAAVGFATAHSLRPASPVSIECLAPATRGTGLAHKDLHVAPAACPLPAGAFRAR